jgi:hypothetical protein
MIPSSWLGFLMVTGLALASAASCSSSASEPATGDLCYGPNCTGAGGSTSPVNTVVLDGSTGVSDAGITLNPLCGTGCLPDQTQCEILDSTDAAAGGGAQNASPSAGANAGSSAAGTLGCFVQPGSPVVARCAPAGLGTMGPPSSPSPCGSASDCAPGYACVGEQNGECRRYCCGGPETCEAGTYCTTRPMFNRQIVAGHEPQYVPVCAAGNDCQLDGNDCPTGKVCTLVADKTTACQDPGTGKTGDPCPPPCAPSYVCALNTCQKLCSIDSARECETAKCLASDSLPSDFGICLVTPEQQSG